MPDHHLLDKVILCILDHSESHNMKECVPICIRHHRVGTSSANQFFKALAIQLSCCDMNW